VPASNRKGTCNAESQCGKTGTPGEPDAMKVARPVRRGAVGNLQRSTVPVARRHVDRQGAGCLPYFGCDTRASLKRWCSSSRRCPHLLLCQQSPPEASLPGNEEVRSPGHNVPSSFGVVAEARATAATASTKVVGAQERVGKGTGGTVDGSFPRCLIDDEKERAEQQRMGVPDNGVEPHPLQVPGCRPHLGLLLSGW
jgi:hypothetical protein